MIAHTASSVSSDAIPFNEVYVRPDNADMSKSCLMTHAGLQIPPRSTSQRLPVDVNDRESEDDGSATSSMFPRDSQEDELEKSVPITGAIKRIQHSDASPLTELIRAFELLKHSPFLAGTVVQEQDDFVDSDPISSAPNTYAPKGVPAVASYRPSAPQFDATQVTDDICTALSPSSPSSIKRPFARPRAQRSVTFTSLGDPTLSPPTDHCNAFSPSWTRLASFATRPRALTSPVLGSDPDYKYLSGQTDPLEHVATDEMCNKEPVTSRLDRVRSRRPSSLRISTSTTISRISSAEHDYITDKQHLPCPDTSTQVRDMSGSSTDLEAPLNFDLRALLPSSTITPRHPTSESSSSRCRSPGLFTEADLRATICPFPVDSGFSDLQPSSNALSHGQPAHSEPQCNVQDAEDQVRMWTLHTYQAMRPSIPCFTTDRRAVSERIKCVKQPTPTRVHFDEPATNAPKYVGMVRETSLENVPTTVSARESPAGLDPFHFDRYLSPLRSGCMDVALNRVPSQAIASESSESSDDILTAPPVLGRGDWHRGGRARRNAMSSADMVAPLPYRPPPKAMALNTVNQSDCRHFSASATVSSFRSVFHTFSRRNGKRKVSHPARSPYPREVDAMTPNSPESPQIPSPQFRRPYTARGQRLFGSRIASMPVSMDMKEGEADEQQPAGQPSPLPTRKSRLRAFSHRFTLSCLAPSAIRHDNGAEEVVASRSPKGLTSQQARSFRTTSAGHSCGFGLGLHLEMTPCVPVGAKNSVPFPSTAPAHNNTLRSASSQIRFKVLRSPRLIDLSSPALTSRSDAASPMLASTLMTAL